MAHAPFHLVYVPGESADGTYDRILTLIRTEDPDYARFVAGFVDGSVAMHLEAEDMQEAQDEMRSLGLRAVVQDVDAASSSTTIHTKPT